MSYSLVMVFPIMLLLLTCIISAIPSSIILVKAAGDYPSYEDCAPYTCGNSTIQYPFGICGLLYAYCDEANQTILSTQSTMEDPISEESSWRYHKILLLYPNTSNHPLDIYPTNYLDFASSYDWLLKGGFFNLSDAYMVGTIVNCTQQPADILVNNPPRSSIAQKATDIASFTLRQASRFQVAITIL
jgi:hypothetical protein